MREQIGGTKSTNNDKLLQLNLPVYSIRTYLQFSHTGSKYSAEEKTNTKDKVQSDFGEDSQWLLLHFSPSFRRKI